jgi:hypothetical protein
VVEAAVSQFEGGHMQLNDISISDVKDLATIIAAAIAVLTLFKGVMEYSREVAHRRLQTLIGLRIRFTDSPAIQAVRGAIENADPQALKGVSRNQRVDFAAFVEEVALMLNSKLISERVAHSMFGFYAIEANETDAFWDGFNKTKNEIYWKPFTDFAIRMKAFEISNPVYNRRQYRL